MVKIREPLSEDRDIVFDSCNNTPCGHLKKEKRARKLDGYPNSIMHLRTAYDFHTHPFAEILAMKAEQGLSVSFSEFQCTFVDRVKQIGHILALMAPWEAPVYLTRPIVFIFHVACLFVYCLII